MASSVVGSRGEITIPVRLRKYGFDVGVPVLLKEEQGGLVLPPGHYAALLALAGSMSGYPLEEMLIAERAAERLREDRPD